MAVMRSARTLYARGQIRYLSHHALPFVVAPTSRSVAGFYRHGHLRRHAAGDAHRGIGHRSNGAYRVAHGDRRVVFTGATDRLAPAASSAPAMAATGDRDAVREHPVSVADGARGTDRRRLAWRRGAGNSPDRNGAGRCRHYPRTAE